MRRPAAALVVLAAALLPGCGGDSSDPGPQRLSAEQRRVADAFVELRHDLRRGTPEAICHRWLFAGAATPASAGESEQARAARNERRCRSLLLNPVYIASRFSEELSAAGIEIRDVELGDAGRATVNWRPRDAKSGLKNIATTAYLIDGSWRFVMDQ